MRISDDTWALEQRIADAKRADAVARKKPFDKIKAGLDDALAHAQGQTVFEQCADRVAWVLLGEPSKPATLADLNDYSKRLAKSITRAVLRTLADHSPSIRAQDEMRRVLGEEGQRAPPCSWAHSVLTGGRRIL